MRANLSLDTPCAAFQGCRLIAAGRLADVAPQVNEVAYPSDKVPVTIFSDETGEFIEIDLRGTAEEVAARVVQESNRASNSSGPLDPAEKRAPGRPKLGVVGREVTLLPRHWEWLDRQSGGASVALRKLVEQAKRSSQGAERAQRAQDAVYRFMLGMAGDLPGFEEACRTLYRKNYAEFHKLIESWPPDVRDHTRKLVRAASDQLPQ